MKINILINGGLYSSQSAYSAWQFAHAAISAGHEITQVFFHQDAAGHGNRLATVMSDEFDAVEMWSRLSVKHAVPLVLCVSAAERRGVMSQEQAAEWGREGDNLHSSFAVQGLGALLEATLAADRMVTFA
ncbi:MAG: sulfurtransferase complex subunit TusD [Gammaproteobacteria bacterium]|nr:sulfurtransferase complex subunit TusD [Gammaproteobacteria bacterium]